MAQAQICTDARRSVILLEYSLIKIKIKTNKQKKKKKNGEHFPQKEMTFKSS